MRESPSLVKRKDSWGKTVSAMEEELAEIFGNAFGDGSFVKLSRGKIRFQLRGHIKEDREHYRTFIIPTFNKIIAKPLMGRNVGIVRYPKRNCYGIATESQIIANFLKSLRLPVGVKRKMQIPDWIKNSKENSKAFIRGLVDTDGSVYFNTNNKKPINKVPVISIVSTSKNLTIAVYKTLQKLGFHPYLIKPYIKKKQNERTMYKIVIKRKNDIKKWRKEIGFHNRKHSSKLEIYDKYGFCPPGTSIKDRILVLSGKAPIESLLPPCQVEGLVR